MKRIVVCCDGTWNRPDQTDDGQVCPSNVTRMALAIAPRDAQGNLQQVYYHPGVGTNWWDRAGGGAFGIGLSRNVQHAYRFLVDNYEPGDQLFFFGFSRGAYTVRSLAGLVRNCGLLRREHADLADGAYRLYRRRDKDSNPRAIEAQLFRKSYTHESHDHVVRIKCIGVWDTVGALGIPVGWLARASQLLLKLEFHDVKLSTFVDNAFQALAVDEKRPPFQPSVWEQQPDAKGQRLEQAWFAGVHTNVGGGYSDPGLSDIAFLWMKDRAGSCGLAFDQAYVDTNMRPNALGRMRDSRTGFYRLMRPFVRRIVGAGAAPTNDTIHPSVVERMLHDREYQPQNVPSLAPGDSPEMPGLEPLPVQ
ncbi:MAG TPA: DUF2235 domain-containing protein [Candidatus Eisenbacteria bacterium]|nr:DUF2235 domain-containing protein [Candidatus Eisenbacteria bacterium]